MSDDPPKPEPVKDPWWKPSLKELTSTAIALAIVGLNVIIFFKVMRMESQVIPEDIQKNLLSKPAETKAAIETWNLLADSRFSRSKDILLVATSFLGLVMGYYFGRIPAERALKTAEKQVDTALKNEAEVKAENAQTNDKLDAVVAAGQEVLETPVDAAGDSEEFTLQSASRDAAMQRLRNAITKAHAR